MRPVLFVVRGFEVPSYPLLLYFGLVAGVTVGDAAALASGMESGRVYVAMMLLIVPALVGARLLFVATHWNAYRHDLRRIWNTSEGGAALYGGLLLSLPLSLPLLRLLAVPVGAFWDVATFTMLVGLVFARIGCLLNGCCGGRVSDARVSVLLRGADGVWRRRIPVQLLEGALGAALLVAAALMLHHRPFGGAVFLAAAAAYGAGRLALLPAREIEADRSGVRWQARISSALVGLALAGLVLGWLGSASTSA